METEDKTYLSSEDWYKRWFNDFYPRLYPHRNLIEAKQQVDAVINLISTRGNCLDIACGTGRHLRYLATHFTRSVGLDLSKELIEIGKLEGNFDKSEVYLADMRQPAINEKFDLVTNFFTGFGYFETDKEHQQMLTCWRSLLKPEGTLLIDYLNRDYLIENIIPSTIRIVDGYTIEEKRSISTDSLRIEKTIVISKDSQSENYLESVRMYSYQEVSNMLKESGFKSINRYGNFEWEAFSSGSERLIFVTKND